MGKSQVAAQDQITYRVDRASQAIRHAWALSKGLAVLFSKDGANFSTLPSLISVGPWLLDLWLDLLQVEKCYRNTSEHFESDLLQSVLDVLKYARPSCSSSDFLEQKAATVILILCKELVGHIDMKTADALGDATRVNYCTALIWITQIAQKSPAIGRLGLTQLVEKTGLLEFDDCTIPSISDLWV